jgi:hypothetical protein
MNAPHEEVHPLAILLLDLEIGEHKALQQSIALPGSVGIIVGAMLVIFPPPVQVLEKGDEFGSRERFKKHRRIGVADQIPKRSQVISMEQERVSRPPSARLGRRKPGLAGKKIPNNQIIVRKHLVGTSNKERPFSAEKLCQAVATLRSNDRVFRKKYNPVTHTTLRRLSIKLWPGSSSVPLT